MWQAYDLLAFFGDCFRFHTRAVIAIGTDDAHLSVLDFNDVFAVVAIDLERAIFVQSIRISQFPVNVNFDGAALFLGLHNYGCNQYRKHHRDRNEIADVKRFFGFEIAFFHLFEYESSFSSKLSTLKVSNVLSA